MRKHKPYGANVQHQHGIHTVRNSAAINLRNFLCKRKKQKKKNNIKNWFGQSRVPFHFHLECCRSIVSMVSFEKLLRKKGADSKRNRCSVMRAPCDDKKGMCCLKKKEGKWTKSYTRITDSLKTGTEKLPYRRNIIKCKQRESG